MCIIITKEKGAKPLPKDIFSRIWDKNPHGGGMLWNDGKCTTLTKGIMKKEDFLEKVKEINKKENSFIVHTRIATHGSVKPENTHPFVSKTLGFAHNGVMNVKPMEDSTDSESFFLWTIADKTFEWCKKNKFLLDMATDGSRCVIFDMKTGDLLHLCEEDWVTDPKYPGYMFSNDGYKEQTYYGGYKSYNSCTGYIPGRWEDDFWDDDDISTVNDIQPSNKQLERERKKQDLEDFTEFAERINLTGLKKGKDSLNIDVSVVDTYFKTLCRVSASKVDNEECLQMIHNLKEDEKHWLDECGIADTDYMATKIMRQCFGRAKSMGYTNVAEILTSIQQFKTHALKETHRTEWTQEEKSLLMALDDVLDIYTNKHIDGDVTPIV